MHTAPLQVRWWSPSSGLNVSIPFLHQVLGANKESAAFGFLLSFYTNPWIAGSGYTNAFGAMAGICAAILVLWIPIYLFGKRIRHATLKWRVMKSVQWNIDREVGE